ncbi:RNA-directed DNA polymerase from mobile element jockey [Lucilia cuprina]|nr:RNA-directed DNA polymerase from mobile element jockey [Lucilia cuprina]
MDIGLSEEYIPQGQFGFKRGNSTVHALLKFHTDVVQNLRKGQCTVAVSLDIEKAFDKAYHDGILYKMTKIGFDATIVKLLRSFFEDRKFCVQVDNMTSSQGDISCGVPQGSVLAPHLYSIFIYDFPLDFGASRGILYADDSLLYAHDESPQIALQHVKSHLEYVDEFYSHWGIKINTAKSNAICLRNASGKCKYTVVPESKNLELLLNGSEIIFKDSVKYLGVNFNKLSKFNNHVACNLEKANRVKGAFSKLFNSKSLPVKTKLLLYKVSIRPILLYAFPIWFTISKTMMRKMEIFERHILRKCIEKNYKAYNKRFSNKFIYDNADIIPISSYALDLTTRFVKRLSYFEGSIMQDLLLSEQEFSWSNTNYLSSIGILHEQNNRVSGLNFYSHITPGIHRG